jgi:hypothetical protein
MYPCGGGSQGAQQSRADTPNAGHDEAARLDGRDVERDAWPSTGPLDPKTTSQREPPPVLLPKSSKSQRRRGSCTQDMTAGAADTKLAARQHVRVVGLRTVRASVEDDSDDRSQYDPVRARTFSTILADHFTPSRRAVGGLRIPVLRKSGPSCYRCNRGRRPTARHWAHARLANCLSRKYRFPNSLPQRTT